MVIIIKNQAAAARATARVEGGRRVGAAYRPLGGGGRLISGRQAGGLASFAGHVGAVLDI